MGCPAENFMTKNETEAYNRGYIQGIKQGKVDARAMKANADGCNGCAYEQIEEWNLPCSKCARNCKDYWRAKL